MTMGNTPAKKTAAKKTAAKKAPAKKAATPEPTSLEVVQDKIRSTEAEALAERVEAFEQGLADLTASVTQREWLLVCNKLDRTRPEVLADGSLKLLALGWIKEKREHGGAEWDRLLDLTDAELLELHGISIEDQEALEAQDD